MKKINSLLALIFLLVVSITTFSACKSDRTYKTSISAEDVAILSIVTFDGKGESVAGLMNLGHSFLVVENISENAIKVGDKEVTPHKTITVGTWSIKSHFGVWYNMESNYIVDYNKYDGRISVSTGISSSDIATISDFIKDHDYWNPLRNCSYFALNLWNGVASETEKLDKPLIYSPTKIAKQLKKFEKFDRNLEIITDPEFSYYRDGTPVFYHLESSV